jgi:hypothetical protein
MKTCIAFPQFVLFFILLSQPAYAITLDTDWWSNQTNSANVFQYAAWGETVRLDGTSSIDWNYGTDTFEGFIEGEVALGGTGDWKILFSYYTDGEWANDLRFTDDLDFMEVYINDTLVGTYDNKPANQTLNFTYMLTATNSFDYRFLFSSGSPFYHHHMIMKEGTVESISEIVPDPVPEPPSMLLFGTGIAGLFALRRRSVK